MTLIRRANLTQLDPFELKENYIILREYIKCVLPPLTEVVGPIMILINRTYNFCENNKYIFNILLEHSIITLNWKYIKNTLNSTQPNAFTPILLGDLTGIFLGTRENKKTHEMLCP